MRTKLGIDDFDEDSSILRDRGSLKVPMTWMDHKLRGELAWRYPPRQGITDAFGLPAGHRPGYLFSTNDAARDARDAAWEERGRILQNAWRNPPNYSPHAHVSGRKDADMSTKANDVVAAWEERGRIMQNAWRHRP